MSEILIHQTDNQPLFLSYDQAESQKKNPPGVAGGNAGDNCVEVFVSVVENPV